MVSAGISSSPGTRPPHSIQLPLEARPPQETTTLHTRILRCMLAVDDSYAYWQRAETAIPPAERAKLAFERRWFGTKSEARIRTLMTDMAERFDAYPEALGLLQERGTVPAHLRPYVCHVHTQLADPIYRRFTGDFLPARRDQRRGTIDRDVVAEWIDALEPGRWASTTCSKFGSNLLATAADAGLVDGKKDPRRLATLSVPEVVLGYALYLLRDIEIEGSLDSNPYLRSLGLTREGFGRLGARIPGIRINELGGTFEITWLNSGLRDW
ncbi:MAG TPA: hypothetical protein VIV60_37010, partial [Polyangiaceae bacterium]